ncbi:hypothetical protein DFR86_06910 [Acidianus sulfidivorans JP7]|uniref:Uncharacterized protein n=1 Tax=Acidianus sulfidivorans JP7 TaxID=619593 RepID=A0A2U9IMP9_9CREN|nr:DNA import protein CedA1 [Acidianus sulfidivorans]AWR97308.1 hypothetical protein DFR86_06910 [Acidianus sulfidivorans JP7]
MSGIESLIQSLTSQVTEIAWSMFILSWAIGWAIRGSPIPIFRLKRGGQSIIEDAIIAAFWLAIGSTIFSLISYLAAQV